MRNFNTTVGALLRMTERVISERDGTDQDIETAQDIRRNLKMALELDPRDAFGTAAHPEARLTKKTPLRFPEAETPKARVDWQKVARHLPERLTHAMRAAPSLMEPAA